MAGTSTPSPHASTGFDLSGLLEIAGGDRAFLGEFVSLFEQDASRLLVEIREATAGLDGEALARSAHSLKGMLSHLGESPSIDLARRLEILGMTRDLADAPGLASALDGEIAMIFQGLDGLVR